MRSYYYLNNVKHDRFGLEAHYLSPGDPSLGDLDNYGVVSAFFDVRGKLSSYDHNRRRRIAGGADDVATITAWSIQEDRFSDHSKQKKSETGFIEELGRAIFEGEQDCRFVWDLISRANELKKSMALAVLKQPDKFIASLYYEKEEEGDNSVIVDVTFSNHQKEDDRFASETNSEGNNRLLWENDDSLPREENRSIDSMLAELAADTNRLFYSIYRKRTVL